MGMGTRMWIGMGMKLGTGMRTRTGMRVGMGKETGMGTGMGQGRGWAWDEDVDGGSPWPDACRHQCSAQEPPHPRAGADQIGRAHV